MKILVPLTSSSASLAPIERIHALAEARVPVEVLLLNVQPLFHRHLAQFTSRNARDGFRQERSRAAMAPAIASLSPRGIAFRAVALAGRPAPCIATLAEQEKVDEIMIGAGRRSASLRRLVPSTAEAVAALTDIPVTVFARGRANAFERYAIPAGIAGMAALLLSAD